MVKVQEVKDMAIRELSRLRKNWNEFNLEEDDFDTATKRILDIK